MQHPSNDGAEDEAIAATIAKLQPSYTGHLLPPPPKPDEDNAPPYPPQQYVNNDDSRGEWGMMRGGMVI